MAGHQLQLPTIQNWSCHSCAGCCRQHLIEITEEERGRIDEQDWSAADGVSTDRPLYVWFKGPPWKKRYRLGHQDDGACIFLDERGLCRIHAKFGEAAKPLPCRIYPYAFHPAGKKVAVSLRFSCPSVVANAGRTVTEQRSELKDYARAVVPPGVKQLSPPDVTRNDGLDWPDFLRFVDALDATIATADRPLTEKLLRALFWTNLVAEASFVNVRGRRLAEFLQLVCETACAEVSADLKKVGEPSRVGRMQFRMLVAQYARKDTLVDVESGILGRWTLLKAALRFARGTGNVPPLQDAFHTVPFEALERPFGGLTDAAEEILTRYFRVKIQGLHFCGRAYYGLPFVEGFRSLGLIYPSILWLARWLAAGQDRSQLETSDVARAVAIADHYHAYSPAFGRANFRRRVRLLSRTGDIEKLCVWYSQ